MLTYNMDVEERSTWLRATPGAAALAQPFYCTEAGNFYGRAHFATARTDKESYLLFGAYPCRNMYMIQHYISNHFNKLNFQNVAASAVSLTVLSLPLYMLAYPLAGRERGRA